METISLRQVLDAPYTYDKDIRVFFDISPASATVRYRYDACITLCGIATIKNGLARLSYEEISKVLKEGGCRQVIKTTEEFLFDPCWYYRQSLPDWTTFKEWLTTYYMQMRNTATEDGDTKEVAVYKLILEQLYNYDLEIDPFKEWAIECYEQHKDDEIGNIGTIYLRLEGLLTEYTTWFEHEAIRLEE